jgi:hypothetical protein
MEHDSTVYVGLDVHKESITVAYAIGMGDVELFGKIGTAKSDIERLCRRLRSKGRHARIVYEAGPCGYRFSGSWWSAVLSAWSVRRRSFQGSPASASRRTDAAP